MIVNNTAVPGPMPDEVRRKLATVANTLDELLNADLKPGEPRVHYIMVVTQGERGGLVSNVTNTNEIITTLHDTIAQYQRKPLG